MDEDLINPINLNYNIKSKIIKILKFKFCKFKKLIT